MLALRFSILAAQRGGAVAADGEGGHESIEVTNKITFGHRTTFKDNSFDVRVLVLARAHCEGEGGIDVVAIARDQSSHTFILAIPSTQSSP